MKRTSILLCFVASLLMFAGTARADTITTELSAKLPTAAPVYCPASQQEWNADPNGGVGVLGYTYILGPRTGEIHLSYQTCVALMKGPSNSYFAIAAHTLYHEWVHAWSLENDAQAEGNAECVSLYFYRYALRHFWGVDPKTAQSDYRVAFKEHTLLGLEYPQYAGTCVFPQPDLVP